MSDRILSIYELRLGELIAQRKATTEIYINQRKALSGTDELLKIINNKIVQTQNDIETIEEDNKLRRREHSYA